MARPSVPEFGKWDKGENVPYTMYFDNARKNRGGKIINPNDPMENPDILPNGSPKPRTKHEESVGKGEENIHGGNGDFWHSPGYKADNERSYGRHGAHPVRTLDERSPIHPQQARSPRLGVGSESPAHHMHARVMPNAGSNQRFEKSPAHPQQSKYVPRSIGSPLVEGRGKDGSYGSNGRPRMTQSKHDQGTTVPRFGQWNDKDQPSENFTDIFEKVLEEKNSLGGTTPKHPNSSIRSQGSSRANEPKKLCGCFPW